MYQKSNPLDVKYIFLIFSIGLSYIWFYLFKDFAFADDFVSYLGHVQAMHPAYSWDQVSTGYPSDSLFWKSLFVISQFSADSIWFSIPFAVFFFFSFLAFTFFLTKDLKIVLLSITLILFSRLFLDLSMNPIRSSLAAIFLLYGVLFLLKGSIIPTLMMFFISFGMHMLTCIALLSVFVMSILLKKFINKTAILLALFFMILIFFGYQDILGSINSDLIGELSRSRLKLSEELSVSISLYIQLILYCVLPMMLTKVQLLSANQQYLYRFSLLISFASIMLISISSIFTRFLIISLFISYPLFFESLKVKQGTMKLQCVVAILVVTTNLVVLTNNIISRDLFFDFQREWYIRHSTYYHYGDYARS